MTLSRRPAERRRIVALVALVCVSLGSLAGLIGGLVSCAPNNAATQSRPLSAAEAQRLSEMRVTNYRDERSGVNAIWGEGDTQVRVAGWVDWKRALAYLRVGGPGAGDQRGLLQAVPGVVATRPATPAEAAAEAEAPRPSDATKPAPPVAEPPADPPADGWQLRSWTPSGKSATPLDTFLSLVFVVANPKPDHADLLAKSDARWTGTDRIGGTTVDVLLGPAVPPQPLPTATPSAKAPAKTTASGSPSPSATVSPTPSRTAPPTALDELGGALRYWLDPTAKLRRFEALLPGNISARVDLDRTNRTEVNAVASFGGRTITPRAPSKTEAALLAKMRQRNHDRNGAKFTVDVPTLPVANLRGSGWLDWNNTVAYVAVHDVRKPTDVAFLRADTAGVAFQTKTGKAIEEPPVPAPDTGWTFQAWAQRADARGGLDIDLLLGEALAVAAPTQDSASFFEEHASFLRKDTVDGVKVTVFEIAKPAEQGNIGRGQARMRYWLDKTGAIQRLEARTRAGTYGQIDFIDGTVPTLPTGQLG
ncbi:hypothetical protein Ais01nite_59950 [Asanoa ishikariensis]|uniref:Uncharacterized protein n=1 Tax=Asanoa ishikariensis TaxID=137265 RepID=A0A1H3PBT0_9ACTN|nr:hypothetical protein [Asanoa ishikariensis]GIF67960.1 hypothetical protein Ais01nite_59950 [Asanoa ishikariensis]SDY98265.1 hypothetical protein SAMN05421684_2734 [Asanoa ishikariensis]